MAEMQLERRSTTKPRKIPKCKGVSLRSTHPDRKEWNNHGEEGAVVILAAWTKTH
jgi:hypothetical protein